MSNGEKYDYSNSNSSFFKKNLYLTSHKFYNNKIKHILKTKTKLKPQKLIHIFDNNKEIKIKPYNYKEKINLINKGDYQTSQTLTKVNFSKFNKKIRHINTLNINQINIKNNINLPFLVPKSPITDRKSILEYFNKNQFNNNIKVINKDIAGKNHKLSNIQRTQTYNDNNVRRKTNIISKKLLKRCKLFDKKDKFLALINLGIRQKNKFYKKQQKERVLKAGIKFINDKINYWKQDDIIKNGQENQQLLIDSKKERKYKNQEYNNIVLFTKILIKNISSINHIFLSYSISHKDVIEKSIISYLGRNFFDIPISRYFSLFSVFINNDNLRGTKFKKSLVRHQSVDLSFKKIFNFKKMKSRQIDKGKGLNLQFLQNNKDDILNLNNYDKQFIYFYFLEKYKDISGTYDNCKFNFLKILRKDLNDTENQKLLLEEFKHSFLRNTDCSLLNGISKKTMIKRDSLAKTNSLKCENNFHSNLSLLNDASFSKNKSNYSTLKTENLSIKNTLLEYNLLFYSNKDDYYIIKKSSEKKIKSPQEKNINKTNNKKNQLKYFMPDLQVNSINKNKHLHKEPDFKTKHNSLSKENLEKLLESIKKGNFVEFKKLYQIFKCSPDTLDSNGNSLLSIGVKSSCFQIVKFLLDEKANPNIQDVRLILLIFIEIW